MKNKKWITVLFIFSGILIILGIIYVAIKAHKTIIDKLNIITQYIEKKRLKEQGADVMNI